MKVQTIITVSIVFLILFIITHDYLMEQRIQDIQTEIYKTLLEKQYYDNITID